MESSKDLKERNCLKCGEDFVSLHVGNRICPSCAKQSQKSKAITKATNPRRMKGDNT